MEEGAIAIGYADVHCTCTCRVRWGNSERTPYSIYIVGAVVSRDITCVLVKLEGSFIGEMAEFTFTIVEQLPCMPVLTFNHVP